MEQGSPMITKMSLEEAETMARKRIAEIEKERSMRREEVPPPASEFDLRKDVGFLIEMSGAIQHILGLSDEARKSTDTDHFEHAPLVGGHPSETVQMMEQLHWQLHTVYRRLDMIACELDMQRRLLGRD